MNFDYTYTVEYNDETFYYAINRLADTVACCASGWNGDDRESWSLSFHGKKMTISFCTALDRDCFVEIYQEVVGDDNFDGLFVPASKCIRGFAPAQCP